MFKGNTWEKLLNCLNLWQIEFCCQIRLLKLTLCPTHFKELLRSYGSRTTSRRDFKPKGLQAEIKTLQAPQNAFLSSAKCCFSKILAS